MSLLDSLDGTFMNFAYGWAFSKPVRKVYYNMTVTALSVAVALIIGSIEIISIVSEKAGIVHGPLAAIANLDLNFVGFVIVGLFVATWLVALGVYRAARVEEKWTARLAEAPGTD
jgi:high-affinity nickel-transport protein